MKSLMNGKNQRKDITKIWRMMKIFRLLDSVWELLIESSTPLVIKRYYLSYQMVLKIYLLKMTGGKNIQPSWLSLKLANISKTPKILNQLFQWLLVSLRIKIQCSDMLLAMQLDKFLMTCNLNSNSSTVVQFILNWLTSYRILSHELFLIQQLAWPISCREWKLIKLLLLLIEWWNY